MKKITLFFAAVAMAVSASAINNPEGTDGNITYLYNCATKGFEVNQSSSAFEADQLVTIAVDISDDPSSLWTWVKTSDPGNTRSIAMHMWLTANITTDVRCRQITDSVWGVDVVFSQLFGSAFPQQALTVGGSGAVDAQDPTVLITNGSIGIFFIPCGFSYVTATGAGGSWWVDALGQQNMNTNPYTGTHTYSKAITEDGSILGFNGTMAGLALPCTLNTGTATGVQSVTADKVVASVELFSILGEKLPSTAKGLVIKKTTYTDGTSVSVKLIIE